MDLCDADIHYIQYILSEACGEGPPPVQVIWQPRAGGCATVVIGDKTSLVRCVQGGRQGCKLFALDEERIILIDQCPEGVSTRSLELGLRGLEVY